MQDTVEAQVHKGTIVGTQENGVCRFSAIPFAQAPTGDLRFRPPEPMQWQGSLDATQAGAIAPQLPSRLAGAMGDFEAPQSEDCLNLTVWTPAADNKKRPVLVWLHGGAWQSGAGALDWYDGSGLARAGDIVVVGVNYRLAALGWLCVPGEVANLGILDEEAAVDWVVENIEAFGGAPPQITVMGQSAGASNIACMLAREPRFQRAIMQSASLGRGFRTLAQAEALTAAIFEALGIETLAQARAVPVRAWLDAQVAQGVLAALTAEGSGRGLFGPVQDGKVLPLDIPSSLPAAAGKVDVLIGYTHDELAAFPGVAIDEASHKAGDATFGATSRQWALDAQARGRKAWGYRFDYAPSARFGACHCIELPFVFGTVQAFRSAPMLQGMGAADAQRLHAAMQPAWIRFIRGESPGWEPAPAQKIFA